jgi:hypothetical protein
MGDRDNSRSLAFYQAGRAHRDTRLGPLNRAALEADLVSAIEKTRALVAYRQYLTEARAFKASRRTVSQEFERAIQAHAGRALEDAESLAGAALRATRQMTQAGFSDSMLDQITAGLQTTGPLSVKDMWRDLVGDQASLALLRQRGITEQIMTVVAEAVDSVDATFVLQRDKPAVAVTAPGHREPRHFRLGRTPRGWPSSVTDLLGRSRFEQVLAAFSGGDPIYLDVAPSTQELEYPPTDIIAIASISLRQRLAEHVRKLEDTGLAPYAGQDPVSAVLILLGIGWLLVIIGTYFQQECLLQQDEDATECKVAYWLITIGWGLLVVTFALGIAVGGAGLVAAAFAGVSGAILLDQYRDVLPGFSGFEGTEPG